jgi:hypothetical protein
MEQLGDAGWRRLEQRPGTVAAAAAGDGVRTDSTSAAQR